MDYKAYYEEWLNNDYFDQNFMNELKSIENDEHEIMERFYKDLDFGTAGLRGIIGAGRNRINKYVVRKTTQGFANYLKSNYEGDLSIAIAYDPRRKSHEFSMETALVLAGNGIKTYLFKSERTTPELSFAVRNLNCTGGVMITASHNPPEYNGYKVYDEKGCQLIPEMADRLTQTVNAVKNFDEVKIITELEAEKQGLLIMIDTVVDMPYFEMVEKVSYRPELIRNLEDKIVYTPLHGTGGMSINSVLKGLGYQHLVNVDNQFQPDGEFPTTNNPNPESEQAFYEGIKVAKACDSEMIIATDPDCDRMGIMVKDPKTEEYVLLGGNQIGILFMDYVLSSKKSLSVDNFVVNTIVSTDLAQKIADDYQVKLIKTLTGFKFIGEQIEKDTENFIMGYEESYGYLFAPHVRDKDAVMGTMMAIEMYAFYKKEYGKNLLEVLDDIYDTHGYYYEETISKKYEGKEGADKIESLLDLFRKQGKSLLKVEHVIDYNNDDTGLPKANVIKFVFEDGSWVVFRPSGTEPKIKVYFSIIGKDKNDAEGRFNSIKEQVFSHF